MLERYSLSIMGRERCSCLPAAFPEPSPLSDEHGRRDIRFGAEACDGFYSLPDDALLLCDDVSLRSRHRKVRSSDVSHREINSQEACILAENSCAEQISVAP